MRELRDLARAVNAASAKDPSEAIQAAFPDPEPLTGAPDNDWDRSPIW